MPDPLEPTMPIRAPSFIENDTSERTLFAPNDFDIFSQDNKTIVFSFFCFHDILSEKDNIEKL